MTKTLLIDADGVTLKKLGYFSEKFSRDHGVSLDKILPFFKSEYRRCQNGEADVKEELAKYLPIWGWNDSIDAFLEYWFKSDTQADEEVFAEVERIRATGAKCYLATDQEMYRAGYIREVLNFEKRLDGCFFSYAFGVSKSQPQYFERVLETLNVPASDVIFLDDDHENVDAAHSVGIDARFYESIEDLKKIG